MKVHFILWAANNLNNETVPFCKLIQNEQNTTLFTVSVVLKLLQHELTWMASEGPSTEWRPRTDQKPSPLKIRLFFRLSSSVEIRLEQTSYCSRLCSVWEQQELSPSLAVGCCTVVFSPWFCQVCGKSAWITFPLLGARNERTAPAPVHSLWCPKPRRTETMLPKSLPWCLSVPQTFSQFPWVKFSGYLATLTTLWKK